MYNAFVLDVCMQLSKHPTRLFLHLFTFQIVPTYNAVSADIMQQRNSRPTLKKPASSIIVAEPVQEQQDVSSQADTTTHVDTTHCCDDCNDDFEPRRQQFQNGTEGMSASELEKLIRNYFTSN